VSRNSRARAILVVIEREVYIHGNPPHIILIQTACRQRFAKMMWRSLGLQPGEAVGGSQCRKF